MSDDSTLTAAKLQAMLDSLQPFPHGRGNDLFPMRPLKRRLGGMDVFEAPPPPARIQVRDIKLRDGTSILSPAFRAKINAELVARFGFRDDIFKDKAYMLGGYGIVVSARNYQSIINWSAS